MALGILEPRGVISHVPGEYDPYRPLPARGYVLTGYTGTTRYFDSNPDSDTDPNIKFENSGGELVILVSFQQALSSSRTAS